MRLRDFQQAWTAAPQRGKLLIVLVLGLLTAALWLFRINFGGRDLIWERIQGAGVWRVGMDPSFPPFENLDVTGRPVGLDVDLAHAIAAVWGVRVEIIGVGFDELVDAVHAHRVDSALSALPIYPQRGRDVSFSMPYVEGGLLLVAQAGSGMEDIDDLVGRRLAAEWGGSGDAEARTLARRWEGDLTLVLRDSLPAALDAMLAGDADAALVDAIGLELYARRAEVATVGSPVDADPYVIVVPHDAPTLLRAINEALAKLAADGTLAEIRGRWLRPEEP